MKRRTGNMHQAQEQEYQPLVEGEEQHLLGQLQQDVQRSQHPWYQISRHTQILTIIYLALFAVFAALSLLVFLYPVLGVDITISRELQEEQAPWLNALMVAISWPGYQTGLFAGLIGLTAFVFWLLRLRLEALFVVALSVISALFNILVKYIVSRPRPTEPLVDILYYTSGQSYPSGHVMSYVAYWGLLLSFGLILFRLRHWWQYLLLAIPAFFVVMVGISRIYLGSHWASDVLGGYLFGGLLLGISLHLYRYLRQQGILTARQKRP